MSAGCCALGLAASLLYGVPALYGAAAASLGALVAFAALWAGVSHGTNGVLGGFVAGFLARALLVGVGLVAAGQRFAIPYVISFFAVYVATQTIEVLFVSSRSGATT